MKTTILANPQAGSLESREALEQSVEGLLGARVVFTEGPEEAERQAREIAREGGHLIVAAGGDGTINDVLNGLSEDFRRARFGILPLGTGNDLARSLAIPADLEEALEVLRAGRLAHLDVLRATLTSEEGDERVRHFINMATGGFSGHLNDALTDDSKSTWGPLSYLFSAIEAAQEIEGFDIEIEVSGGNDGPQRYRGRAVAVMVANGRCAAGGVQAAPEACVDDGLLDVVVLEERPLTQLALLMPRIWAGRHLGAESVHTLRGSRARILSDRPFPFNLDGEESGGTPALFEVLPGVLETVVGEDLLATARGDD
jgi:diacylglycerol kinase (ATP)